MLAIVGLVLFVTCSIHITKWRDLRISLRSKRFRGVGKQRKFEERDFAFCPRVKWWESRKEEARGGGEGSRLQTNPWILKTSVRQRTGLVIGWASRTLLTCVWTIFGLAHRWQILLIQCVMCLIHWPIQRTIQVSLFLIFLYLIVINSLYRIPYLSKWMNFTWDIVPFHTFQSW